MKALILNFTAINGKKDADKMYYKFDMVEIPSGKLYPMFVNAEYTALPGGEVPSKEDCRKDFPRIADVDFQISQFTTKDGKTAYGPQVDAINSWKKVDLSVLK